MILPANSAPVKENGDKIFLASLYHEFYPLMKYVAFDICHNSQNTKDAVQVSFVRLIDKVHILRGLDRPALLSYVVQTVRYTSLKLIIKERRERNYRYLDNNPEIKTPEKSPLQSKQKELLKKALAMLCIMDRDLLNFRFILNLSNKEIGKAVGIHPAQVSWHIHLAICRAFKNAKELSDNCIECKDAVIEEALHQVSIAEVIELEQIILLRKVKY